VNENGDPAAAGVDDYEILPLVIRSRRRSRPPVQVSGIGPEAPKKRTTVTGV